MKRDALCINVLFVSLIFSATAALFAQNGSDGGAVVARVGGENLTLKDLQRQEGRKLLQAEYKYYLTERQSLDDLIDDQLLANEAHRLNISLDTLLQTVVYKDVKDPTEDQLEVYYEGLDTQDSYTAIRNEVLEHIRELRRAKARLAYVTSLRKVATISILLAPPSADVDTVKAYAEGPQDAPVELIEFADYQCPYCQTVNPEIQRLKKEYGEKLRLVFKDFPLPMHHEAEKAAEAARCAGEQGQFWQYHDVLFYSRQTDIDSLQEHARVLKLDGPRFDACLNSGSETAAVKRDLEEGKSLGLNGTPSFFINGHFLSGAIDYATLRDMVNQQLNAVENRTEQPLSQARQEVSQK